MGIQPYKQRYQGLLVIQRTEDNAYEVFRFIHYDCEPALMGVGEGGAGEKLTFRPTRESKYQTVCLGDWVSRDADGIFQYWSDEEFNAFYEPEDPPPPLKKGRAVRKQPVKKRRKG